MNQEDSILDLFDKYFQNANEIEILEDVAFINSLGKNGVTFEEYLSNLNAVAAIPLVETGICDDVAFSDLYNTLISSVSMDDYSKFQTIKSVCIEAPITSSYVTSETTYPMAA